MLSSKLALGDSVILGIDHNEDVRSGILAANLRELGLTDAILDMHSSLSPPATFARNISRTPIDSIWVSANVMTLRSGYCPFDGTMGMKSDHGLLWIEVCNSSILGKRLPATVSVPASRVCSDDPRSRNKYIRNVQRAYQSAKVPQFVVEVESLGKTFQFGDVSVKNLIVSKYESLHKLTTSIRFRVEPATTGS